MGTVQEIGTILGVNHRPLPLPGRVVVWGGRCSRLEMLAKESSLLGTITRLYLTNHIAYQFTILTVMDQQ